MWPAFGVKCGWNVDMSLTVLPLFEAAHSVAVSKYAVSRLIHRSYIAVLLKQTT